MRNFEILRFEIRQFAVRLVNFMAFAALVFVRENLCVKGRASPPGSTSALLRVAAEAPDLYSQRDAQLMVLG